MKKAHEQGGVRTCREDSYWATPYDLLPTTALFISFSLSSLYYFLLTRREFCPTWAIIRQRVIRCTSLYSLLLPIAVVVVA